MVSFVSNINEQIHDVPKDKIDFYFADNTAMMKSSFIPPQEGTFYNYHFIIPIHYTHPILIDNKLYSLSADRIFSGNPGQLHRAVDERGICCTFYGLFIEQNFLEEISKALYNVRDLQFRNKCFNFTPKMEMLMNSFIEEANGKQPGHELFLQNLSIQIAVCILRDGQHNQSQKTVYIGEYSDKASVKKAIDFLTENCDKGITLDEMAREVNYSTYHFLRIFKAATGITPSEYLMNIKIEKAKNLLKHTDYHIMHIGFLCGFISTSHFTQAFKRKTGVSPSYYKKNI